MNIPKKYLQACQAVANCYSSGSTPTKSQSARLGAYRYHMERKFQDRASMAMLKISSLACKRTLV